MIVTCIPAHNEEKTIARQIVLAQAHCQHIVVCDDGSTDLTGRIARGLGAEVVVHERNRGYGAALRSLFLRALELGADYVVTMDGDGQHNPVEIPRLLDPLIDGRADICIGSRFLNEEGTKSVPRYRAFGIRLITTVANHVAHLDVRDAQSGFRAYTRNAVEGVMPLEGGMGASTEILVKAAERRLRIIEVPIQVSYRGLETSGNGPVLHGLEVVSSLLRYLSVRHPLVFYGVPAALLFLLGVLFTSWALWLFAVEGVLQTSLILIALSAITLGSVLATAAVILFTLVNVLRRAEPNHLS